MTSLSFSSFDTKIFLKRIKAFEDHVNSRVIKNDEAKAAT
jgi:hypothetical protein